MDAPQNSHEAADQLAGLSKTLRDHRDHAGKHALLRDRFERLYRRESAKATLHDEVSDLSSADKRKAAVDEWRLGADVKHEGGQLCEAMGLAGTVPDTVGDLRWLRDRAASLADSWSAKAYDARTELEGWRTVASMARSEMELDTQLGDT